MDQPTFHYNLDVRTGAFHDEPYKNGHTKVRPEFCRADHGDDILYVHGNMFEPDYELPHGRYYSDDEKNLCRRMMKGTVENIFFVFFRNIYFFYFSLE